MSERKRRYSNVCTPSLSKSLKYQYADIPDVQISLSPEESMDAEWAQEVPWEIIDAWIKNQKYISWLMIFQIAEETTMSMLRFLQDWAGKCSYPQESMSTEKAKSYASSSEDKVLKDVTEETKLSAIILREEF